MAVGNKRTSKLTEEGKEGRVIQPERKKKMRKTTQTNNQFKQATTPPLTLLNKLKDDVEKGRKPNRFLGPRF
jgi:hypothetical protein